MSNNKVVLITGALGGIGTEIARQFLDIGYRVIATLVPSEEPREEKWLQELGVSADRVRFLPVNLTNHEEATKLIQEALEAEGRIDVLVNNAGITRDATFKKMTFEQWSAVLDTNLKTLFTVTQPVFLKMLEQKSGRIINISSINGLKGQFGQTNYSATKAGIIGFTKALAYEGARSGICVNAIAPGYTMTPMVAAMNQDALSAITKDVPMQRLAEPKEIAAGVIYLASDDAAYVTGETLSINGGLYMH